MDKIVGKGRIKKFLSRHPDLSIRKTVVTLGARAVGFNKVAVDQFFALLTETVDKYKLTADKKYNLDRTEITAIPKGSSKIIASKGKRHVGTLTSEERGETATAEICFLVTGAYMPPMLIFPRKQMQQKILNGRMK